MNQNSSNFKKYYSPLIGAALATASLFHFALPVLSIGTSAGTSLINSATATYDDQDNNSYDVTSNEVTVTVGKIAGITNVPFGFTDNTTTNTAILPGDEVFFDFEVTNTGNDFTNIFIPDTGNVAVQNLTVTAVEISTDGGATFTDRNDAIFSGAGIVPDVLQNTSIIVRVIADVSLTAVAGDDISVQLGDTGTNTADLNSTDFPGTQNQPDLGATGDVQAMDVRTENADNPAVGGDPVNGQREAGTTQIRTIGSQSLALPRLEKTNAGVAPGTNLNGTDSLADNVITYDLELDVAGNSDPTVAGYSNFLFNAEALEGRDYSGQISGTAVPAILTNLILISDAIPANTELDTSSVDSPTNGLWTPVYTTDALTTAADDANWTTDAPASGITRVGWVYDAETNAPLAVGSTTTGFGFDVITTGLTDTFIASNSTAIYNMAQVFGSTDDGATGAGGLITYDESGDQNPTNLNDDGTFGPDETATDNDGNGFFGFADPDTVNGDGDPEDNVDVNNNNTGTGSEAGEVNRVIVTPEAVTSNLFNGPDANSEAVGDIFGAAPADDNHDFQNLSAPVPTAQTTNGVNGAADTIYNPDPVVFTNTVTQPATTSSVSNVILEPVSPEALLGAGGVSLGGNIADLPTGTTVTIDYDEDGDGSIDQTATYSYNSGTGAYSLDSGAQIVIPSINGANEEDYFVTIDLPAGTPLSTNFEGGDPSNPLVGGFPVVIAAYIDDDSSGDVDVTDTYNVTVNQVYTGYLQLLKKARVLRDDGSGLFVNFVPVPGMGFDDPDADKFPAPGDILEYQITYTNISEDGGSGTGNGLLFADDVVITEDGRNGNNNWALDNDSPNPDSDNLIDTLHPVSGANDTTTGSVITFFDENDVGNTNPGAFSSELTNFDITDDIVKYEVSGIARLEPGEFGVFTFQRRITAPEDIDDLTP